MVKTRYITVGLGSMVAAAGCGAEEREPSEAGARDCAGPDLPAPPDADFTWPEYWIGEPGAAAGDVNGDGIEDVLVQGRADMGLSLVSVHLGTPDGPAPTPWTTLSWDNHRLSTPAFDVPVGAPVSVAAAGDVNGDGFADLLLFGAGFPDYSSYPLSQVALGGPDGLISALPLGDFEGEPLGTFGHGDFDGDEFDDVVLSTSLATRVFRGGPDGPGADPSLVLPPLCAFGACNLAAGDFNADGYDDLSAGSDLLLGGADGLAVEPVETPISMDASTVAIGDVNGDGFADVLGSGYANHVFWSETLLLVPGTAAGLSDDSTWSWTAEALGPAGLPVATVKVARGVSDVDGDGFADMGIAVPTFPGTHHGGVLVFKGSPAGLSNEPSMLVPSTYSVGNASWVDLDGDERSDLLVEAGYPAGTTLILGRDLTEDRYPASGPCQGCDGPPVASRNLADGPFASAPDVVVGPLGGSGGGTYAGDNGIGACWAGDVNGDGSDDLAVGDPSYYGSGSIGVYYGSIYGFETMPVLVLPSGYSGFGNAVTPLGDIDGDGYDDLITHSYWGTGATLHGTRGGLVESVGAPSFGIRALAVGDVDGDGRDDVLDGTQLRMWDRTQTVVIPYGSTPFAAGDIDADGHHDLLLGEPDGADHRGVVSWYRGGPDGLEAEPTSVITGDDSYGWFGVSVANLGDVDADGFDDILVGSPGAISVEGLTGAAFVYGGSPCGLVAEPIAQIALSSTTGVSTPYVAGAWPGETGFGISVVALGDPDGDGRAEAGVSDGLALYVFDFAPDLAPILVQEFPLQDDTAVLGGGAVRGAGARDLAFVESSGEVRLYYGTSWVYSQDPDAGCGCATGSAAPQWILALAALLGSRRRRSGRCGA